MRPTQLGKYTIQQPFICGSYGAFYLAADPSFIERFRHEAQVAARLEHPQIVPVYELAADHRCYYNNRKRIIHMG